MPRLPCLSMWPWPPSLLPGSLPISPRGEVGGGEPAHVLIEHVHLPRVSPMAVPVMLDIGKEGVASASSAMDELLDTSAAALIGEAIGDEKDGGSDAEGLDLGAMDLDAMARALDGR